MNRYDDSKALTEKRLEEYRRNSKCDNCEDARLEEFRLCAKCLRKAISDIVSQGREHQCAVCHKFYTAPAAEISCVCPSCVHAKPR